MFRAWTSGAAGAVLALGLTLPAMAATAVVVAPPQSLRDALFPPVHPELGQWSPGGMPPPPPVARYRLDVGESFVIDRLGRDEALFKFDRGDEVWALKGVTAAHGDVVFKNDMGEPVLRATRWGGVTLFTPATPGGMPAALEGGAVALHAVTSIGPQALLAVLAQSSARAGRAAGRTVLFNAPVVRAEVDWLFADAAQLAADAFVRAAQDGRRTFAARFSEVRLSTGRASGVAASGAVVLITIAPERGVAGRPSSLRILTVVERR